MKKEYKIAVIGQGYVGLPLALAFSKHYPVIGYDINAKRIAALRDAQDETKEADQDQLRVSLLAYQTSGGIKGFLPSCEIKDLAEANVYIITVPTPINEFNAPDLSPLRSASRLVGEVLKPGDIVIYESTVYPGCTEEECIPVVEATSKLVFNRDFFVGYSPERINPGDKVNTLETIVKVTSGSTPAIADEIKRSGATRENNQSLNKTSPNISIPLSIFRLINFFNKFMIKRGFVYFAKQEVLDVKITNLLVYKAFKNVPLLS